MKNSRAIYFTVVILVFLISLGINAGTGGDKPMKGSGKFNIKANMVFFYYKDLNKAVNFYENTLGLHRVLDYGFAKAFQVSKTSLVCLVDETKGMHKTSEPKTVTLSIITLQVDEWYEHLKSRGVKIHSPLKESSRIPIKGFVALDSEGYFLEFQTFKKHPQNEKLLPLLKQITPINTRIPGKETKNLMIQGTICWLYYQDLSEAQSFYQNLMNLELLVDQGFAQVYASSPSGFIGLVDAAKGLHGFSQKKSVNVGYITDQVDQWYQYLVKKGLKMRDPLDEAVKGRVRAFVCFDVAGYYLEFDTFPKHKDNQQLLDMIK